MTHAPARIFVVPRWAGRPSDDWYPWVGAHLEGHPRVVRLEVLDMPDPAAPTLDAWGGHLRQRIPLDARSAPDTILIGHSVGCQAVLRHLATAAPGVVVRHVLCVAGWWTVDAPWDTLRPWIETPFDHAATRRAASRIDVLLSDDDPFTADHQTTAHLFADRLGARVQVASGRRHFNEPEEPDVLAAIRAAVG